MPDIPDIGAQSGFNDVLTIDIDLANFGQQLDQMASMYAEKIKSMPNLGDLGITDIAGGVRDMQASIDKLATGMSESLGLLSESMHETADNIEQGMARSSKAAQGFFDIFTGSASKAIATALKFTLAYGAVHEILKLTGSIIEAPFKAILEGAKYAAELADRSAELQGSIAANVTYSKNLADNFRIAGQEATAVVRSLQDVSLKTNLPEKQLDNTFKALLQSGAPAMTTNMQGIVALTEMFALAMNAAGKSVEGTRALISEIPRLLDGTVSSHSKILEVLHLTKDQWEAIRQEAIQHHDLVEQLAPRLMPYLTVVEQASLRYSVASEQVDLILARTEALVGGPIMKEWVNVLERIKQYYQEHHSEIDTIAASLGTVGELTLKTAEGFANIPSTFPSIIGSMGIFVAQLAQAANWTAKIFDRMGNASGTGQGVEESNANFQDQERRLATSYGISPDMDVSEAAAYQVDSSRRQEFLAKFRALEAFREKTERDIRNGSPNASNVYDTTNQQLQQEIDLLQKYRTGKPIPTNDGKDDPFVQLLQQKFLSGRGPTDQPNKAGLASLKSDYADQISSVKQAADESVRDITTAEQEKTKSVHDATQERIAIAHDELNQLVQLGISYIDEAKKAGASQEQLSAVTKKVGEANDAAFKSYRDTKSTNLKEDAKAQTKTEEETIKGSVQRTKEYYDSLISLTKSYVSEGITGNEAGARQIADYRSRISDGQLTLANLQVKDAGQNEVARAEAENNLAKVTQQRLDTQKKNEAEIAAAAEKDYQNRIKQEQELLDLQAKRASDMLQKARQAGAGRGVLGVLTQQSDAANVISTKHAADTALAQYNEQTSLAVVTGVTTKKLDELQLAVEKTAKAYNDALLKQEQDKPSIGKGLLTAVVGPEGAQGLSLLLDPAANASQKLAGAADLAAGALKQIPSIIGTYQQGAAQGGTLGGVGAVAQGISGTISGIAGAFKSVPFLGPIVGAVGEAFSIIGDLFSQHARNVAKDIEKNLQQIMQAYSIGQTNLIQTISALQQQRDEAIAKLSGQKGGQKQLDNILPNLNQQIAQLQYQAQQTRQTFNQQLAAMEQGGTELQNWYTQWVNINKQVKDYIGAGGSLANANAFLTASLKQLTQQYYDKLNSGEQQAIQDALTLNNLLTQRSQLMQDEANKEFGLLTQDSLQRRASVFVTTGQQIQAQHAAYQKQLDDLDNQISLETQKVAAEKQVFTIASDKATLEAQSNALTITQLNEQLALYRQMQQIIAATNGLQFGSFNPNFIPGISPAPTPVVINVTAHPGTDGRRIGVDISTELARRGRFFLNT